MGRARDLFKKIGDTNRTFHAKMGIIKDRNSKDLTKAEEVKKRWQEYTEGLYKKGLKDQDNYNGVVSHLEPGILECEVKWALGSISQVGLSLNKTKGGDGITGEICQILKDAAAECCTHYDSKFGKLSSVHKTEKIQFSFQSQRMKMP